MVRPSKGQLGMAGLAWLGEAQQDMARQTRHGTAERGQAWRSSAWQTWHGWAQLG